ncbi:MAG: glycosyltransferase family 2 protein [Flavobacteriales bacterium]
MEAVKVSVIMPAFNSGKYIAEAIESIVQQTFINFELIVVNDGSSDNTAEVVRTFSDQRIRLIELPVNQGNRIAANTGIKEAAGEYIARMDADDISLKDRLQMQVDFLNEHHHIGFCGAHIELFGADSGVWNYPVTEQEFACAQLFGATVVQGVSMMRKKIITDHQIYYSTEGKSYAEDIDYFYRLSKVTRGANVNKVLLRYRRHAENITTQLASEGLHLNAPVFKKIVLDMGIPENEMDITAHFWLNSRFMENITPDDVKRVYDWMQLLKHYNKKLNYVSSEYFNVYVEKKWDRFFYRTCWKGKDFVETYMKAQQKNEWSKRWYSFKMRMRGKA